MRSFFNPGCAPAPAPRQRMARPLAIKQGEGAPPSEKSPPCRAGPVPGELENALLSKGDLREVPLRGKGSRPSPEENGKGVSFAGGSPPLPGIGKPPWRAGGRFRESLRIPCPRKGTCGKFLSEGGGAARPREKRGGRLIRRGQPAPAGDWGTALPGWACSRESLRIPHP